MMIGNLKTLCLALVAISAMSAVAASTASAVTTDGELTSTGPVTAVAADEAGAKTKLTAFGAAVECNATYTGHKYNVTPHVVIPVPATTFTVTPHFTNCTDAGSPTTVTMNGCDYVGHLGETIGVDKYDGTLDIVCSGTNQIEVHVYSSASHATTICTFKIPAQIGLEGSYATDLTNGKITLGGPTTGLHSTKTGILCGGTAETNAGVIDLEVQVEGKNEAGGATSISLSD